MDLYCMCSYSVFFVNDSPTTRIYTLSLHDALPICPVRAVGSNEEAHLATVADWLGPAVLQLACSCRRGCAARARHRHRSEEHTSELQSLAYLVCRLLLEKKKKIKYVNHNRSRCQSS